MKYIKKGEVVEAYRNGWGMPRNFKEGDWLVKSEDGEFRVCEKEVFEKSYVRYPENYIERMEDELLGLDERITKLRDFLKLKREEEPTQETIGIIVDLTVQLEYMEGYKNKLFDRYKKERPENEWLMVSMKGEIGGGWKKI